MDCDSVQALNAARGDDAINTAVRFLTALFDENDIVLFRPIETWKDSSPNPSRVIYDHILYRQAVPSVLALAVAQLLRTSAQEKANVFFGACPRFGDKEQFEQAWQIRVVPALWSDVDGVTVEEVLSHIAKSELPTPSIVVNSGNGVHVYWLLDEPYLIDDASDPPPVLKEWVSLPNRKPRCRKYILDPQTSEKLYLDVRANVPELSPKATHITDVIAGVGAMIGGDHTHDLSRLLRVPGTLNRKDERNGQQPLPCTLVSCDAALRYPVAAFESFAKKSPQGVARRKVASITLPTPRTLTPTKRDKLNELVNKCAAAPVGERSEADWALICRAIEKGWPKAEVWTAVAGIGKFAEAGDAYFERTWSKAEQHTRERQYEEAGGVHLNTSTDDAGLEGGESGSSNPGLIGSLAQIIGATDFFAQDEGSKLYRFQAGAYRPRAEVFVKVRVKKLCESLGLLPDWSSHLANEVVEFIRVDSPLLWQSPPVDVVNVKNGLLNVKSGALAEHTSKHLSPVQLPVIYDPAAICPRIDQFISEVFPGDSIGLAYEIAAWLMTPDTSFQKAILLIGSGGNGKSRYLRMIESFLGKSNVSNMSLHRIESDKFACARLYGKLANICPDLPSEHLTGTSMFKAITVGDPITGEYKFKDSFDFEPYARLMFSANSPPRAHDASDGFFDRWLVVPFDRRFRGDGCEIPADRLDAMLCEPTQLSGLLNRSLQALSRLRTSGRFMSSASLSRAFTDFQAVTDPIAVWLDCHTLEGPRLITPKGALISAFNDHRDRNGRSPISERAFGLAIKKLRPEVTDKQRTISGKVLWCYIGIGLKCDVSRLMESGPESPACADPQGESLGSRDSRDSASINLSHTREEVDSCANLENAPEQDRANRVNRVNGVNGDCQHEYVESTAGNRIRTGCRHCGKLLGYRPVESSGAGQVNAFSGHMEG